LAYSNALLIASGSPYHKQQYQQHTQTTKIPWENQDRVIRANYSGHDATDATEAQPKGQVMQRDTQRCSDACADRNR
jgi:hypothetical protein